MPESNETTMLHDLDSIASSAIGTRVINLIDKALDIANTTRNTITLHIIQYLNPEKSCYPPNKLSNPVTVDITHGNEYHISHAINRDTPLDLQLTTAEVMSVTPSPTQSDTYFVEVM